MPRRASLRRYELCSHFSSRLPGVRSRLGHELRAHRRDRRAERICSAPGLRREHVGAVVLFCAAADAVLIAAGVMGMAQALGRSPGLARALALAGAAFLAVYGWRAMQRAMHVHKLDASAAGSSLSLGAAAAQAAAFTLLNPHVYLDTVLLVGSIGAQQPAALQGWFIAGPPVPAWSGFRCWVSARDGSRPGLLGRRPGRCSTA